jgi:hypothetical protein
MNEPHRLEDDPQLFPGPCDVTITAAQDTAAAPEKADVPGKAAPTGRGTHSNSTTSLNPVVLTAPSEPGTLVSITSTAFSAHSIKGNKYLACTLGVGRRIGYVAFVATEDGYKVSPLDAWRGALGSSKNRETGRFLSGLRSASTITSMNVIAEGRSLVRGRVLDEHGMEADDPRYISIDEIAYGAKYRLLNRFMQLVGQGLDDNKDFIHTRMKSSLTSYIWIAHAIMSIYLIDRAFFEEHIEVEDIWLKRVVERSFISAAIERYMIERATT